MESRTVRGAMNMRGARRDVKWKSMALVTVRTCGDCRAVWQWQGRDKPCRLCVSCVNVCVCVWNPGGAPVCSVPSHVVPCGDARCGVSPWHIFPGICKTVSSMLNMNRKKHRSFSFDDFVFCDPTGAARRTQRPWRMGIGSWHSAAHRTGARRIPKF